MRPIPIAIFIMMFTSIALCDDAANTFEELYGDKIKKVKVTSSRRDDLELAKELLRNHGEENQSAENGTG